MKFLTDEDGLYINTAQITAARIKDNKNDGTYKNNREYPFVADVHVAGKEKPFTIYLSNNQKEQLYHFMKNGETCL